MSWLYLRDDLEAGGLAPGSSVELGGAEARHALTVTRMRVGEHLSIGNGRGLIVSGPIVSVGNGSLVVEIDALEESLPPEPRVTLVQALAKGDRDELAIQAATELGIDRVVPWAAERSVSRWNAQKALKGRERWNAIVREAAKQSLRAWVPEVGDLADLNGIAALSAGARVLVLEPGAPLALSAAVSETEEREIVLVVGPEGGVSPAESARLRAAGAEAVRLGGTVLRTSTAGPSALTVLNVILGRW